MVFKSFKDSNPLMTKIMEVPAKLKARDYVLLILIPINAIVFVATLVLNFLASMPELSFGLFTNGITNVSRQFEVNITPVGPTFAIWSVIYLSQAIAVLYGLSLIFRFTKNGLAYANPPILSRNFYLLSTIANVLNIVWLFTWDRLLTSVSAMILATLALSVIGTTTVAARAQQGFRQQLLDENRTFDIGVISTVVVNGWAIYGTWTLLAAHINLAIMLTYDMALGNEISSLIALGILMALALAYTAVDIFLLGRYTRSLLTPSATLLWAAVGITSNNFDPNRISSIVSLVLAIFAFITLIAKITLVVFIPRFGPPREEKKICHDLKARMHLPL